MADKQRFFDLLEEMKNTFIAKNKDYGDKDSHDNGDFLRNFKEAAKLGVDPSTGVLVRMSDKWMRIQNLQKSGTAHVKNESMKDTLLDLANYALICICALEDEERSVSQYVAGVRLGAASARSLQDLPDLEPENQQ